MKISESHIAAILEAVNNRNSYLQLVVKKLQQGSLGVKDKNALVELLSDEFARAGLRADDEPNEYGQRLDDIIGILDFED